MAMLFPPIIDNTVSAFIIDEGKCKLSFYFQNDETEVNTDYVIVQATVDGIDVLKGAMICKVYLNNPDIISSNVKRTEYAIEIKQFNLTQPFMTDKPIQFSLIAIAKNVNIEDLLVKTRPQLVNWIKTTDNSYHSQWSDFARKIPIPSSSLSLSIDGHALSSTDVNKISYGIDLLLNGELTFNGDTKDVISWYQIKIYDSSSPSYKLLDETSRKFPMRDADNSLQRTFSYDFNTQLNKLFLDSDSQNNAVITVIYQTTFGYTASVDYFLVQDKAAEETNRDDSIILSEYDIKSNIPNGSFIIHAKLTLNEAAKGNNGYILVLRADKRKQPLRYEEVLVKKIVNTETTHIIDIEDVTVEAGVPYVYELDYYYTFYNQELDKIDKKYCKEIIGDNINVVNHIIMFDEIFLTTKDLSLKVFINPEISSYKRNIIDTVTNTLGGAYPFIRRNGNQIYRTFGLNGLITFEQEIMNDSDVIDYIMANDSRNIDDPAPFHGYSLESSLFLNSNNDLHLELYSSLDKKSRYKIYQKLFRDKVMEFLYSDQIVLFRSQQEGNMFVKLTNISLTPNAQLDRQIWTFSAQAVEILPTTAANYSKYFSDNKDEDEIFTIANIYITTNAEGNELTQMIANHSVYIRAGDLIGEEEKRTLQLYQKETKYT